MFFSSFADFLQLSYLTYFLSPQSSAELFVCQTSREVSEEGTEGAQGRPPQNVSLWYANYFELKTSKAQKIEEEPLNLPLTA